MFVFQFSLWFSWPSFETSLWFKNAELKCEYWACAYYHWRWDHPIFLQLVWDDCIFSEKQLVFHPWCHCALLGHLTEPWLGYYFTQTQSNYYATWKLMSYQHEEYEHENMKETLKDQKALHVASQTQFQGMKVSNDRVIVGWRTLCSASDQSAGWWGLIAACNWSLRFSDSAISFSHSLSFFFFFNFTLRKLDFYHEMKNWWQGEKEMISNLSSPFRIEIF